MAENIEAEVAGLKQRVYHLEQGQEDNKNAHTKIYGELKDIAKENTATEERYKQIMKNLEEIKEEIKNIKDKPSKRMDLIITAIISVLVSGIGMFIINNILIK